MNHGKRSGIGQLIPVEYNRLTVSGTVLIDKPAGGYMDTMEYRNSARGHLIALETKSAMKNGESVGELTVEGSITTPFWRKDAYYFR